MKTVRGTESSWPGSEATNDTWTLFGLRKSTYVPKTTGLIIYSLYKLS